jgi:RNA polymerase sigma-70 factor (ECF subfamily)
MSAGDPAPSDAGTETLDIDLVVRAQHADEAAFERLAETSYGRLLGIAYRILRDRAQADDAVQHTLIEAWRTLPRLRDPARFEAWTYRILVRACHQEVRRHRGLLTLDGIAEPAAPDDVTGVDDRDLLERAFRSLSVEHRAVVVLHHHLGMTLPQVAEALDIPVGTVGSRLSRAMTQLRHDLRPDRPGREPALREVTR